MEETKREYLGRLAEMDRAGDAAKAFFPDKLVPGDKNICALINALRVTFQRQEPPVPWPLHWKRGRRRKYS